MRQTAARNIKEVPRPRLEGSKLLFELALSMKQLALVTQVHQLSSEDFDPFSLDLLTKGISLGSKFELPSSFEPQNWYEPLGPLSC